MDFNQYTFRSPISNLEVDKSILTIDAALQKMAADGKTETDMYKRYSCILQALLGWAQMNFIIENQSRQMLMLKHENDWLKMHNTELAKELNIYTTLEIAECRDGLQHYLDVIRIKASHANIKTTK